MYQSILAYRFELIAKQMTNYCRVMLTSFLRALVKNPVKESFYRKRKKNN